MTNPFKSRLVTLLTTSLGNELLSLVGFLIFFGLKGPGSQRVGTSSRLSKRPFAITKCSLQTQVLLLTGRFFLPITLIHYFNTPFCLRGSEKKERYACLLESLEHL